jgi:hypothetical protein
MSKGKSAPQGTQKVETTQTNLPPYAEPYYRSALERAMFESARPYEPFMGQRLAQFAPEETFAQRQIMGMGRPSQIGEATDIFRQVAGARGPSGMDIAGQFQPGAISPTYRGREFQTGYDPREFQSGYTAGGIGDLYRAGSYSPGYTPGQISSGYQAGQFDPGFQAREYQPGYQAGRFQTGYQAGQFDPGYQAGRLGASFEAGSLAAPGAIEQYMSPYQRMVTDVEKQAAVQASQMQGSQEGAAAARAGAKGGTREALIQAERQKGLGQQLAGIEARGAQGAFDQAQRAFEADRAARLAQGQFGVQAFQTQEAARQQQAQFGMQAQQAGEQARQEAARMGLSAQQQEDAARQAQEQFSQRAFGMGAEQRQFQANIGLQAQQAGEQARQEAARMGMNAQQQNEAARQAAEEFQLRGFQAQESARQQQGQLGLGSFQAQEAARQQQQQAQFQAQQAGEQARQRAAEMGLNAQQQSDAANRAAQEFFMRADQFNIEQQRQRALLGFQGLESDRAAMDQRLRAGELLRGTGLSQQESDLARLQAQLGIGGQRRGLMQQGLDIGYEDFLRQQAFPREQLSFLSNLLQGVPVQPGATTATFGRVPTPTQQMLGAGLGAAGLYQTLGRGG